MSTSYSPRRPARARVHAAAWLAAVLLAACVAKPVQPESKDLATASDQTDGTRRARLRLELAGAYFARGQTAAALDDVKVALAAWPEFGEAYNLRGLIYASMGESGLAVESFKRALAINPRDGSTMHNYAWYQCQERRYAEADAMFEQALAQTQYRETTRTLLAKGVCQARNGRWPEAEASLTRAYELDPANPATAVNLTDILYRRGQFERARFYIRRVNEVPDQVNAQTLWLAARIELRLGNLQQARDMSTQLTQRFPQSPEALSFERGQINEP